MIGIIGTAAGMLAQGAKALFGKKKADGGGLIAQWSEKRQQKKETKKAEKEAKKASQVAEAEVEEKKEKMKATFEKIKTFFVKNWYFFAIAIALIIAYKLFFKKSNPRGRSWSRRMHAAKRRRAATRRRRRV